MPALQANAEIIGMLEQFADHGSVRALHGRIQVVPFSRRKKRRVLVQHTRKPLKCGIYGNFHDG
jgi:hypothetical protein